MQVCMGRISLNEGISKRNYLGCLLHYFMLSFVFVSVDSLQPWLLQNKFSIERKQQIENFRNALVIAFDILVKLSTAPLFGYLADRYGRQRVNLYGILVITVTMLAMPYAPTYWLYVLLRCFYATGAIAISVVPLLADYISHSSRGTSASILVLMSSLGALASAYINFTLLDTVSQAHKIYVQYGVISALILVIGTLYTCLCLKPGHDYYPRSGRRDWRSLWLTTKQSLKSPEITNGYTAAFLARGDSILLSLYLVLWTYSWTDPASRDEHVYDDAFKHASMLSGIAYSVIMLTCIVYGLYYERRNYSRCKIMMVMLTLAAAGAFLINFTPALGSFLTYLSVGVLGLGMSGLLTASLYLVNQYSTPESRGFITGIQTWFGVVGILLQTIIGALLYEYVYRSGPFNYFAATCLVVLLVTALIYRRQRAKPHPSLLDSQLEPDHSPASEDATRT